MRSAFGRKISKFFRNYSFAFLPRMIFLFGLFFKIFLTLTTADERCVLAKNLKIFLRKFSAPIIQWRWDAQVVHFWRNSPPSIHYQGKRSRFSGNIWKNISTFPTGHEKQIWPNFFEKIIIFIPLYLSEKNVNPINAPADAIREIKNDKVYQSQMPKVLLGKIQ